MKTKPEKRTYPHKVIETVQNLMRDGWTNEDIHNVRDLKYIPDATLRTWRKRLKDQGSVSEKKPKTPNLETPKTLSETQGETAQRNEEQETKPHTTPENAGFLAMCVSNFHPADLIYYTCLFIACRAVSDALNGIGYTVSAVIAAVVFVALQGIKSERGRKRIAHLVVFFFFEAVFFALHYSWANAALWQNVKSLPFDIWVNKYNLSNGELVQLYGGSDLDKPAYVAAGVAVVMLVCSLYVVWIAMQQNKNNQL